MAGQAVHPVQVLKEQSRTLEAAATIVLADPKKGAVHKLRSGIRRIQAQTALLEELPGLPDCRKETRKLAKLLRKAHRAAGDVRDLDVQLELLGLRHHLPRASADTLAAELTEIRDEHAEHLKAFVEHHLPKLAGALEALRKALEPAEDLSIGDERLAEVVARWSEAEVFVPVKPSSKDDRLHEIRKAAKTARYMAEAAEGSPAARTLAARYEAVQDIGGKWHDWLQLGLLARKKLGKRDPLVEAVNERAAAARATFIHTLANGDAPRHAKASTRSQTAEPPRKGMTVTAKKTTTAAKKAARSSTRSAAGGSSAEPKTARTEAASAGKDGTADGGRSAIGGGVDTAVRGTRATAKSGRTSGTRR